MPGETEKSKKWYSDKDSFCSWIKGPSFALYLNYFLSAWGDRMWHFAVALYLVHLSDGMLRLAAIFGFTGGILMLIFGGIIGDWVDRNGRIKVVTVSLFIQNIAVALCAVSVCMALKFEIQIEARNLGPLLEGIIIGLALIAYLASMAYKIAIEKDWIVVVASGSRGQLSKLNAVTRALDLSCKILAPTCAGIIMSYSLIIAAIVIAVWNVMSVFLEYLLLRRVYNLVPALAIKGADQESEEKECELQDMSSSKKLEKEYLTEDQTEDKTDQKTDNSENPPTSDDDQDQEKEPLNADKSVTVSMEGVAEKDSKKKKKTCLQMAAEPFVILAKGWKTYARQKVVFAGLALSLLYMTVLGFDCITTGYIYANGVKETYVGVSMAAAGLTGIIGTFVFTRINKRLGLERTGLTAFSVEITCLLLSVASVWAPGTRFDPFFSKPAPNCTLKMHNDTLVPLANSNNLVDLHWEGESREDTTDLRYKRDLDRVGQTSFVHPAKEMELRYGAILVGLDTMPNEISMPWSMDPRLQVSLVQRAGRYKRDANNSTKPANKTNPSYTTIEDKKPSAGSAEKDCSIPDGATLSIILFLVGIVTSRIGLWMADLVVTQLMQENVLELERGIVNGVQNSLNMLNDMIKFALVIVLPKIETFGILIILSFAFICLAGGLFFVHVLKTNRQVLSCKQSAPEAEPQKHVVASQVDVPAPEEKNSPVDV